MTADNIVDHLDAFQAIADANGGTRAAGTPGHVASAAYVSGLLATAGYRVWTQPFTYTQWFEDAAPTMARISPTGTTYTLGTEFNSMAHSGSDAVTASLVPVDLVLPPTGGSTSGCEAADFPLMSGRIALVQRGTCTFQAKAENAAAAGAGGIIIFNEGNTPERVDVINGTVNVFQPIPVMDATFAIGNALAAAAAAGPVRMAIKVTAHTEQTDTYNVLADSTTGRSDRITVIGGHLDSVAEGPGINDNGSGTATILEIALQMARLRIQPRNLVRFAFWSGEEDGLIGSQHYVDQLTNRDVRRHALNINPDMVASPNYGRFVYDGDGSASAAAGPNGSDIIEGVFNSYFTGQGLTFLPTAFDGRSDYGPFIDRGNPAGGLFTGAEDIKTAAEAVLFGGTAGAAFDACYHQACDDDANINMTALEEMADAAAHATLTFAMTTSAVNGSGQGAGAGSADFLRNGTRFVK